MKFYRILIVVVFILQASIVHSENSTFEVRNNSEFLNSLGSNRTLLLINDEFIFPDRIDIKNYNNLSIIGSKLTKILVKNRKLTVIGFINCDSLMIDNLYIGHQKSPEPGCEDERGTVMFQDCTNSIINRSTFYGCGKVGVKLYNCKNITFNDFTVKECTEGLFGIFDSEEITFNSSIFRDTYFKSYDTIQRLRYLSIIKNSEMVKFNKCVFKDNILIKGDFIRMDNSTCQMNKTIIQYCTGEKFSNESINLVDTVFKGTSFYEIDKKVTINVDGKDVDLGLASYKYTDKEIKQLLDKGADVNMYLSNSNYRVYTTPLVQAMRSGKRENIEILLENGANLYQKLFFIMDNPDPLYGGEIYTILHYANIHFLRIIKNYDLNLEIEDEYGATPLFYAAFGNYLDKVKFLVEHGANINHISDYWSIIGFPAYIGNVKMVKYLVDNGANVNLHNNGGYSPLLYCGLTIGDGVGPYDKNEEKYQIAKYLVNHGADINYKGNGSYPITISNAIYKSKMCDYILRLGARVEYDPVKWTIVHDIAMRGSTYGIYKLITEKYNLYAKSYRGVTILSGVVKTRNFKLVKQLIENGMDINENAKGEMRNYSIGPVITEAVERGDLEMVIFLYNLGADINIIDKLGRTPIKVALEKNLTEIVQQLKNWEVIE